MGLTDRDIDTKKLMFGADWIEVRTERMYGDTVDAQKAAARNRVVKVKDTDKDAKDESAAVRIEFDISEFNLALVTAMTVAWSDDAPITTDNYRLVPDRIVQEVLIEILGVVLDEEDEKDLEKASSSQSDQEEESSS